MKYFVLMAFLPCILAAEIQNTVCADGTQCSQGKYCCESGCCDTSKEMQDKGYVPALTPASPLNLIVSEAEPNTTDVPCLGTQCGQYCHSNVYGATCCRNQSYSCPPTKICCGDSYSEVPWCCKNSQQCGQVKNQCIDTADSCDGTLCEYSCHENGYGHTCCSNPEYSCPPNTRCCGVSPSGWCCKQNQQCSLSRNLCVMNSAVTTSVAMMSMLFAFMMGTASKYFL